MRILAKEIQRKDHRNRRMECNVIQGKRESQGKNMKEMATHSSILAWKKKTNRFWFIRKSFLGPGLV